MKSINSMNAKALLNFLEGKYEKLTGKNEKLLFPINNQIIKRVPELKEEFIEEQKKKIFKYIAKHTDRELNPEEKKKVI